MTLYVLQYSTYYHDHGYGYYEYYIIGVFNDMEKLKEQFITSVLELNNIKVDDIKEKEQEWLNMDIITPTFFEYGYHPHPIHISKHLLNNDIGTLYEPGGEKFIEAERNVRKLL